MERNREARRGTIPATANGLSRRRQRSSSLRDSPEEDGGALELQEMARLRDRANKKDRDRDRDRLNRSKRRRGERSLHGSNREEGGEDSSDESLDDDEEEDDEDAVPSSTSAVRLPSMNPMAPALVLSTVTNHHHHQRKSFPPKVVRAAGPPWKVTDEMIGVSVPRKARSGSVKRSHECWNTGGGVGSGNAAAEPIFRQASTSPARPSTVAAAPPAPVSPSSSNASARKKLKPIGAKNKPPKISKATSSSSIQEIEIEVAEVLFGMTRQFQCTSKQETATSASNKTEARDAGGSSNDAKSRVSSPVSASPPPGPPPYLLPQNSSSTTLPSSAVAPKRRKPRPVKFEEESPTGFANPNVSTFSSTKTEDEQLIERAENSSPKIEKDASSAVENGGESSNLGSPRVHMQKDSVKMEIDSAPDSNPTVVESDSREGTEAKDNVPLPVEQSPRNKADVNLDDGTVANTDSTACAVENPREEKFMFDLMAPPSAKSSPERDAGAPGFQADLKPSTPEVDLVPKAEISTEDTKAEVIAKQDTGEAVNETRKMELTSDASEIQKQMRKERNLDLQLDVDMQERDTVSGTGSKQQVLKQHQQSKATKIEPKSEKAAQSASLPLPITVPGWPGSFPPLGYMGQVPAVQAVVSMERSTGSSTAIQPPIFPPQKPQPKRCATHFYIAKNIYYHQQFVRMNPFWHTAAGSAAALYGTKPYNLNAVPPAESTILLNPLQGSLPGRNLGSSQDNGQAAPVQGQSSKEKSLPTTFMDVAQKKQLMLQQAPQPTSANSMLQAPAFIFSMNQQQAAAAATASRSGPGKSPAAISNANPSSGPPNSVGVPVASVSSSTTVSFNYPNLPANDSQYLAIVSSNGYPFPIPAPVGAPPPYRGNHAQAVPFFSAPFYPSQMLHPSQIQQQQHPQSQPPIQQGHQNTSTSSGSSSSQKQQQQQQQLLQSCSSNTRNGTSQSFPALKQRQQQVQPHNASHPSRLDSEAGSEDSPSTSDSRVLHAQKNVYNHNFAIPVHHQNFTLMSSAALAAGNHSGEKQQQSQQQQQLQSVKGGMELTTPQAFAMSFTSFNNTAAGPGLDFSSIAHSHPVFQSLPEAARHGYQIAAAAAAQSVQKKNHPSVEEGRAASDAVNANASSEDDKKTVGGKSSAAMIPHSLVFSRPEGDPSMSSILGNSVIDSSARTLNLISSPANGSRATSRPPVTNTPNAAVSVSNLASQQLTQQQQQLLQLQKQHQAVARTKPAATNNANVFTDRLPPTTMAKFPNTVSVFPQALIQGSSPNQTQWKNSTRTGTAPIQSPTATMQSMKSLPQQQGRVQVQGLSSNQTQISFGVNPKSTPTGQQLPAANAPPSAGSVVGSPSASISKGSAGSPMTSAGGKVSPSTSLPSQPAKNSQPSTSRKSSPVGGRNVSSIQSNSHASPAQSSSAKPQQQPQQNQHQQAQLQKQPFQQAPQLFFPNAYLTSQSPHSIGNAAAGFYQRREQQQQSAQQNSVVSSSGMMSIGSQSLTPAGAVAATDPAKAVAAAAANNLKTLPPQGLLHAAQFAAVQSAGNPHPLVSTTFPYIHAMPAVSMKPPEQKPVAGNEPEKR